MTTAITAKRAPAVISVSASRATMPCKRDFSTSTRLVTAVMPLASTRWFAPASKPAASTTRAATSVVPSTLRRLAATYAATIRAAAPPSSTAAATAYSWVHSQPAIPANPPSSVKVRTPAKRACGPLACPDHSRSIPTAAPHSVPAMIPTAPSRSPIVPYPSPDGLCSTAGHARRHATRARADGGRTGHGRAPGASPRTSPGSSASRHCR